ncbi:hypothetical protein IQ37_02720 [Chryseobacterium piperi]|uniref:Peptidase M56 domain-containing protein n=1 Tax=Chryseobacterium piperi TaxID=558152 RepID=A0A086BMC8_9FLAO|nr:hypothetical protein IQ37_02720 [Chryseobacterium piperi]
MFSIILKIILCSSLLITVYYLFLEKEKMYRFNRFFLLFSLAFSYLVPFISITTELPKPIDHSKLVFEESTQQALNLSLKQENFNWATVIWIVYGSITLAFLIKALISMFQLKGLKGKK